MGTEDRPIARVWFGRTRLSDLDRYAEYLGQTGVPDLRATEGNRGVLVLARSDGPEAEYAVISFWRSLDDVERFAGDDPARAVYYPEDERFLIEPAPTLVHYDVVTDVGREPRAS